MRAGRGAGAGCRPRCEQPSSVRTAALTRLTACSDGAVVAAADAAADLGKAVVGQLACEVHGDLACGGDRRAGDRGPAAPRARLRTPAPPRRGSRRGRSASGACPRPELAQHVAHEAGRGRLALQRGIGDHADQRALERTHAAVDPRRRSRPARRRRPRRRRGGRAWRGSPGAARPAGGSSSTTRPARKRSARRASRSGSSSGLRSEVITSWRPGVEQRVEGVEELLARLGAAGEELDVVDQHHVGAAEAVLEVTRPALAHRVDEARS